MKLGASPAITLTKLTNGANHGQAPGVFLLSGSTATVTYTASNTGNVPLSGVVVRDDNGTPGSPADDFDATPVDAAGTAFNVGDTNDNGLLDPTENWIYTATRTVTPGQYTNIGTATGTPPGSLPNVPASPPGELLARWAAPSPAPSTSTPTTMASSIRASAHPGRDDHPDRHRCQRTWPSTA